MTIYLYLFGFRMKQLSDVFSGQYGRSALLQREPGKIFLPPDGIQFLSSFSVSISSGSTDSSQVSRSFPSLRHRLHLQHEESKPLGDFHVSLFGSPILQVLRSIIIDRPDPERAEPSKLKFRRATGIQSRVLVFLHPMGKRAAEVFRQTVLCCVP